MFIFCVYPQLYTPQFLHNHAKSKCTMILSDLHRHFHIVFSYICVLPSDFFLKRVLESFSFKATNKNHNNKLWTNLYGRCGTWHLLTSSHIASSQGFVCALSIFGVCQGVICIFCAVKLNIQNGCWKHKKLLTNF